MRYFALLALSIFFQKFSYCQEATTSQLMFSASQKLAREDYTGAIVDLSKILKVAPDNYEALEIRCFCFRELRMFEDALSDCNKAINLFKSHAELYSSRGDVYMDMGDFNKAVLDYDLACMLDPYNAEFYMNKANALDEVKRFREELEAMNAAIKLEPNNGDYYLDRAYLLLVELERPREASEDFTKAINLGTSGQSNDMTLTMRGHALFESGKYPEAEKDFLKVLVHEEMPLAHVGLAKVYYHTNDLTKAKEHVEKALGILETVEDGLRYQELIDKAIAKKSEELAKGDQAENHLVDDKSEGKVYNNYETTTNNNYDIDNSFIDNSTSDDGSLISKLLEHIEIVIGIVVGLLTIYLSIKKVRSNST